MPAVATAGGIPSKVGKYELLMPLAAGGMARIYIGRSTGIGQFERHVVLKMITPERANDLTAVNMFLDEARLAASLNHQNVAQVFEVGEEGGVHFLAMEYVHGQDLRAVLAKAGSAGTRIPLELALTVVAGAAAGLNHAHERRAPDGTPLGIVHRDVSPSNIMIGYDGAVKLLDFGIAKATHRSVETQSGIIKGKFAYMAPEQCRGRDVDRRSDVFSLGIILYEISTQHRCFRADSDFDTMHRIVTGDVVRPTRLVQGYPPALEAIVMKALAIDANQRYQSAGLLLEALESFAVSSRMSLSTMGLGRFMRDMFGEQQEPWLNASMRMAAVTPPKENTISSTGGGNPRNQQPTTPNELVESDGSVEDEGRFEDSDGNDAAKTLLEMPSNVPDRGSPQWNPRYPAAAPSLDQNQSGSHRAPKSAPIMATQGGIGGAPAGRLTPPQQVPVGTQPIPSSAQVPQGQWPQHHTPGSGSSPAAAALRSLREASSPGSAGINAQPQGIIASTKHGYASGAPLSRADISYPLYEPPRDSYTPAEALKPNRRPLFIGLGVVALGVVVLLVMTLGGGTEQDTERPESDHPDRNGLTPAAGSSSDVVDDSTISIIIHSDPPGADVLIADTKIGETPFEKRVVRGNKITQLTVRLDGYVDYSGRIDLGGEYENKNIKLVRIDTGSATTPTAPDTKDTNDTKATGSGSSGSGSGSASGTTTGGTTTGDTTTGDKTTGDKTTSDKTTTGTKTTGTKTTGTKTTGTKTTGTKTTGTKTTTGTTTTTPKAPKCQPPGPNVDPFGLPVCKT